MQIELTTMVILDFLFLLIFILNLLVKDKTLFEKTSMFFSGVLFFIMTGLTIYFKFFS